MEREQLRWLAPHTMSMVGVLTLEVCRVAVCATCEWLCSIECRMPPHGHNVPYNSYICNTPVLPALPRSANSPQPGPLNEGVSDGATRGFKRRAKTLLKK